MGLSVEALAEASATLVKVERIKDRDDPRAEVCGCGHTMAKHERSEALGTWTCFHGYQKCRCAHPYSVLKVPNARVFSFRNDEAGCAVMKGVGRTVEIGKGHRLDWVSSCSDCAGEPVTVVELEGGKRYEPRCGAHR